MLKGGVIMDVVNAEQAKIAEDAGAAAVMALERVPAQIRKEGGVARASDPAMFDETLDDFLDFCSLSGWEPAFHQAPPEHLDERGDRRHAAVIDGGAGPVEEHRFEPGARLSQRNLAAQ